MPIEKDDENERPIPLVWRPKICSIVDAFVQKDYALSSSIPNVLPVSAETSNQLINYIEDFGETLTHLPGETWESSVCLWMGNHWDVLIDLWTIREGRSDLVLGVRITESNSDYEYEIGMIYVP